MAKYFRAHCPLHCTASIQTRPGCALGASSLGAWIPGHCLDFPGWQVAMADLCRP